MLRGDSISMLNLWIDRLRKEISQLSNAEIIFDVSHASLTPIHGEDNVINTKN